MNPASLPAAWIDANQRCLGAALDEIRLRLETFAGGRAPGDGRPNRRMLARSKARPATLSMPDGLPPAALDALCGLFSLSAFERSLLLLCAGMELDGRFGGLCAAAKGDPNRPFPTFSLALSVFPDAHWSALSPQAPLRRWRLVETSPAGPGYAAALAPLRIDERILNYLVGVAHLDERLGGFVESAAPAAEMVASHQALAERLVALLSGSAGELRPSVQLCGPDPDALQAVASAACQRLGLALWLLPAQALPLDPRELTAFMRLWERESALSNCALLLDCGELDTSDVGRELAIRHFAEGLHGILLIAGRERRSLNGRMIFSADVARPTPQERREQWRGMLNALPQPWARIIKKAASAPAAPALRGSPDELSELEKLVLTLSGQFDLGQPALLACGLEASAAAAVAGSGSLKARSGVSISASLQPLAAALWETCRRQSRPRLENLAQRLEPAAVWEDLVLPAAEKNLLDEIAAHVRQRARVYETWGFAALSPRGLGVSALFAGESGTGKTMAAEVLASRLGLDLYRIDLSAVVSKYIGETEKNLRRVFDAAEDGGAILLFDEADALFGRRSEVKDSHDRYANIEISYLLQRLEAYRGLAILTTNMKESLDPAFLRRIRFVVRFPFPDVAERMEIWQRVFPPEAPRQELDYARLARLNLAGGNIRNAAVYAAFLAADAGQPISMAHLLRATQVEYAKLERSITETEFGEWS